MKRRCIFPNNIIFFLSALGFVMWGCTGFRGLPSQEPTAVKGFMDLSHIDISSSPNIALSGEWEFYWQAFLTSTDFQNGVASEKSYIKVPGVWNSHQSLAAAKSGSGFATYRLNIKLAPGQHNLSLKLPSAATAYELYINGHRSITVGVPGTSRETMRPFYSTDVVSFIASESFELIFHVSNFYNDDGGLWNSIEIGDAKKIYDEKKFDIAAEMFIVGGFFLLAMYHFAIFLLRTKEKSTLYFGLFCLVLVLRTLSQGNHILFNVFPRLPWEIYAKLGYLTYYICAALFSWYFYYLFPKQTALYYPIIKTAVVLPFCIFTLLTKQMLYYPLLPVFHIIVVLSCLYIVYLDILALIKKKKGSLIFLTGFLLLVVAIILDILRVQNLIETPFHLTPIGFYIFIFSQAYIIGLRFAHTYNLVAKLFRSLHYFQNEREKYNRKLKQIVKKRTFSLRRANSKLKKAIGGANKANQAKSEFLAKMSHEIRTPLNGILGFAEIMEQNKLPARRISFARLIVEETENLLELINQLLDISSIETGKLNLKNKPFDLTELLDSINTYFNLCAQKNNLHYTVTVAQDVPVKLIGDSLRLRQILINLIGNAFKFTKQGFIAVDVGLKNRSLEKALIVFTIKDSGVGIPENDKNCVFQSFTQGTTFNAKQYGGTGLGTAISKKLVEKMNGEIGFESRENEGSCFWFTTEFLIQLEGMVKTGPQEDHSNEAIPAVAPRSILVVEDYPTNQEIALIHLTSVGHQVTIADHGEQAIELCRDHNFDLILMDVQMPVLDGYEATVAIRRLNGYAQVPILGMTANAYASNKHQCLKAGMNDVIVKPIKREAFLKTIHTWLLAGKPPNHNPEQGNERQ